MEQLAKELIYKWNPKMTGSIELGGESITLTKEELDENYVSDEELHKMPDSILVNSFTFDEDAVICIITDDRQETVFWHGIIVRGNLLWTGHEL